MRKNQKLSHKFVSSAARRTRGHSLRSALPELLEGRMLLSGSIFQVTTTADLNTSVTPATYHVGDTLSLRQAIMLVNGDASDTAASPDLIEFSTTDGNQIQPATGLPSITNPVLIDGTTQPGYARSPVVELNGALAGLASNGLDFEAGSAGSVLKGLTIDSFSGAGVVLNSGSVTVLANYIGTDPTGTTAAANNDGVDVTSNNNTLTGNLISGNNLNGVSVSGNGNVLQGNLIGTDYTGTQSVANSVYGSIADAGGVYVSNASGTLIGGPTAADRNVISGNDQGGVVFVNDSGLGNVVQGNYVGLDVTGEAGLGNSDAGVDLGTTAGMPVSNVSILGNVISGNFYSGIYLNAATNNTIQGNLIGTDANGHESLDSFSNPLFGNFADGITIDMGSSGNLIGGTTASARNVLSGNYGSGITVVGAGAGANAVEGNFIGVDVSGQVNAANLGDGILVDAGLLTVGGSSPGMGNVISANAGFGVDLEGGSSTFYGNLIGVAADGVTNLGNAGDGVHVNNSNGNVIGGDAAGQGNVIAFNGALSAGRGVNVVSGVKNSIEGNSIFFNTTLGIDLGGDGVTLNDANGHAGPNNFQDFPVLGAVTGNGTSATVTGTMTGTAGSQYVVDFYDNTNGDASGYGQGQTFAGSQLVTIGGSGSVTFSFSVAQPSATQLIWSATATDALGNTSEFSADAAEAVSTPVQKQTPTTRLTSSLDPSAFGQSVTFTAAVTGGGSSAPTGSISFYDGTTLLQTVPLSGSTASFTTSSLNVASHAISASYSGDGNYTTGSTAITQSVTRAASSTLLSVNPTTSTFGQSITLTATVSPTINGKTPTGTVTFNDGPTTLGTATLNSSGVATLTVNTLSVGSHVLVAMYSSDSNFAGSTSNTVTETVSAGAGSISGVVYRDVTGNGFTSDDKTLSGVTVQLVQVQNGKTAVIASVVSAINGGYTFSNVSAGNYQVQEVVPTGFVETEPTTSTYYTANVSSGAVITGDNFDNYATGCCCGSLSNVYYTIDGRCKTTSLSGHVNQGDTVSVTFTIASGYVDTLSLVSYIAPGSTFSASTASQQTIYQDSSGTFGKGTYTLTVVIPPCYFQVDFVCGDAINQFGPAGSNIFYSAQDRLISSCNGGTRSAAQAHV